MFDLVVDVVLNDVAFEVYADVADVVAVVAELSSLLKITFTVKSQV